MYLIFATKICDYFSTFIIDLHSAVVPKYFYHVF